MIKFKVFFITCLCLLSTFAIVMRIGSTEKVEVVEKRIDTFPYTVGGFQGKDIEMSQGIVDELNTDAHIFRRYLAISGDAITLYIGYYGTRKGGRSKHIPLSCYPGSGWSILESRTSEFDLLINGQERRERLNFLRVKKGTEEELVYYWNQVMGDKILSSGIQMNYYRFLNKILYNRNDGSFVRVSIPLSTTISNDSRKLLSFVREIYPIIVELWPVEKTVREGQS